MPSPSEVLLLIVCVAAVVVLLVMLSRLSTAEAERAKALDYLLALTKAYDASQGLLATATVRVRGLVAEGERRDAVIANLTDKLRRYESLPDRIDRVGGTV